MQHCLADVVMSSQFAYRGRGNLDFCPRNSPMGSVNLGQMAETVSAIITSGTVFLHLVVNAKLLIFKV